MYSSLHTFIRLWLITCLTSALLYASDIEIAAKIVDKTVLSLFPGKSHIKTWAGSEENIEIVRHSATMTFEASPEEAEFFLVASIAPSAIPDRAILFTTDIDLFYNDDRVIGAFYWQKGRPNLIFLRQRLEKFGLNLSKEFNNYIEEEL